jgi:hypothetical protein
MKVIFRRFGRAGARFTVHVEPPMTAIVRASAAGAGNTSWTRDANGEGRDKWSRRVLGSSHLRVTRSSDVPPQRGNVDSGEVQLEGLAVQLVTRGFAATSHRL